MKKNIILIGFMGTGKTTVGMILAERLNCPFADSDALIEARANLSISDIFKSYGEKYFRILENEVIRNIINIGRMVIATGGGAVLNPENFKIIKENGIVIALDASPDTLWARLKNDCTRPLLASDNPRNTLESMYKIRRPVYSQAHHVVSVDDKNPEQIVEEIIQKLKQHQMP
jgi:shikimate kinase